MDYDTIASLGDPHRDPVARRQAAREERRAANQERAMAEYMRLHQQALEAITRIESVIANHDLAPDPERISWATVGDMGRAAADLKAITDWMFNEGEYAE